MPIQQKLTPAGFDLFVVTNIFLSNYAAKFPFNLLTSFFNKVFNAKKNPYIDRKITFLHFSIDKNKKQI